MLLQKTDALSLILNYVNYCKSRGKRAYANQYHVFLLVCYHNELTYTEITEILTHSNPISRQGVKALVKNLCELELLDKLFYGYKGKSYKVKFQVSSVGRELLAQSLKDKGVQDFGINPLALSEKMSSIFQTHQVQQQAVLILIYMVPGFSKNRMQNSDLPFSKCCNDNVRRIPWAKFILYRLQDFLNEGLIDRPFIKTIGVEKSAYLTDKGQELIRSVLYHPDNFYYQVNASAPKTARSARKTVDESKVDFLLLAMNHSRHYKHHKATPSLADYFILAAINREGVATQLQLAEQLFGPYLSPNSVNFHVRDEIARLGRVGLVERLKSDDGGSTISVGLSPQGVALLEQSQTESASLAPYASIDFMVLSHLLVASVSTDMLYRRSMHLVLLVLMYYAPGSTQAQMARAVGGENHFFEQALNTLMSLGWIRLEKISVKKSRLPPQSINMYWVTEPVETMIRASVKQEYAHAGATLNRPDSTCILDYLESVQSADEKAITLCSVVKSPPLSKAHR